MGTPTAPKDLDDIMSAPVTAETGGEPSTDKRKHDEIGEGSPQSPLKRDRVGEGSREDIPSSGEQKPKEEKGPSQLPSVTEKDNLPQPGLSKSSAIQVNPKWSKEKLEAVIARAREIYRIQEEIASKYPRDEEEEDWPCCTCCGMDVVTCHEIVQDAKGLEIQDSSSVGSDASFTPLLKFKEDHHFYDQLKGWAEKALAYFNNKNNKNDQNLCFEEIERVSSSTSHDNVYLLTINVRDTCSDDLKILQAKISSGTGPEGMEVKDCKLVSLTPC